MSDELIDKHGFLVGLKANSSNNLFLEFGCGNGKHSDLFVGIDIIDSDCVDIVGDVFSVLDRMPVGCVYAIYAAHFIEHVPDLKLLMQEFTRVLNNEATLELIAPHFSNAFFYSDPTHRSFFGLYTMSYFANDNFLRRQVPIYARVNSLDLMSVHLVFKSFKPRYFRHLIFKMLEMIFNINYWTKELYEEIFSRIIPCYEIVYKLKKLNAKK